MHYRSTLRTHENNTNNKLESHNQKLKKYLSGTMRLPEAVEQLVNFIDEAYAKSSFNRYENLITKIDVRNTDGDLVQYSLICNSKSFQIITKTRLYSFDPLKPHFYIVKLGFTGVYIIYLFLLKNIYCGYSLEPPRRGGSNEYPQYMF